MNPEIKKRWLAALASGDYVQGRTFLKQREHGRICHCVQGVLAELAVQDGKCRVDPDRVSVSQQTYFFDGGKCILPEHILEWAGFDPNDQADKDNLFDLALKNDAGISFANLIVFINHTL